VSQEFELEALTGRAARGWRHSAAECGDFEIVPGGRDPAPGAKL